MRIKWLGRAIDCAAGVVLILPLSASAQNLVTDGTFTEGAGAGSFTTINSGGVIGPWTVGSGSVDLIGSYWQGAGGGYSLDMSGDQNGSISQTITLPAGKYTLTFDESGNPDGPPTLKQLSVSLGNAAAQTFSYDTLAHGNTHQNMDYVVQTAYFTLSQAGTVSLVFTDNSASSYPPTANPVGPGSTTPWGAVIGNVSLTAVPEPTAVASAALLLLLPLGASASRILRKNRGE